MKMWDKMDRNTVPDNWMISEYTKNTAWDDLFQYILETYSAKPIYEYSRCAWPGWNVKMKKAGKNLCTLYPFEGYFWVLVVIGKNEKERFEEELPSMSPYLQQLYIETEEGMGQRWLKLEIEDIERLKDVKQCISIKRGEI